MAAAERRDKPSRIRTPPQRQRSQLQPRCPALGAGRKRHHRSVRQDRSRRRAQQRRRLLGGETELGGAQLSQLAAGPQPRKRQRRVSPAGHYQQQAWRQILQQERDRLVHRASVDQVVVVQDQQHLILAGLGSELVDQGRRKPLKRTRGRRPEQRAQPLGDPGLCLIQSSDHVAPEPGRVVVAPSRPSHATGRPPPRAQSASSDVLPNPAGAQISTLPRASPSPSARTRRGRGTKPGRGRGTCSLVASRASCPDMAAPAGACRRPVSHRGPTAPPASEPRSGRWTGPFYGLALPTGRGPNGRAHHRKIPPACHLRVTPQPGVRS